MGAETINMRTDGSRKRRLQMAADLSDRSLTSFILSAAEAAAEEVIAQHQVTTVPADFFDSFFDAIAPSPSPVLVDAAGRLSDVVQRG